MYFIKGCQHRLGYKFPEVYLVPTLFLTPEEKNSHNSINKIVNRSKLISFRSIDYNNNTCTRLKSNEAIVSENGRFKLILEDSGNLIIKDDVRTMWESVSGYIPHTVSPYYLHLTPMCQLRITSKNGYAVWFSASRSEFGKCYIDIDDLNKGFVATNVFKTDNLPLVKLSSSYIKYSFRTCRQYSSYRAADAARMRRSISRNNSKSESS